MKRMFLFWRNKVMSNSVASIGRDGPSSTESAPAAGDSPKTIIVERRQRVGLITLNRPKALNALNSQMAGETLAALKAFDADDRVGAIVITGSARAFAAGADIAEMAEKSFMISTRTISSARGMKSNPFPNRSLPRSAVMPSAAAANSHCSAISSSPRKMRSSGSLRSSSAFCPASEVRSGWTRAVGKSLAMDLILTGRTIGAAEAKASGLVARIVPASDLLQVALEAAHTIAGYNAPAVKMAKEAVNAAFESPLSEGLRHERLLFKASFATEGQKEGMNAFVAKRAPVFRHR